MQVCYIKHELKKNAFNQEKKNCTFAVVMLSDIVQSGLKL